MRSLNQLLWLQRLLVKLRWAYFVKFWGMDIHPSTVMSLSVRLDKTYPKGVHIGPHSYLAFDVAVLAHDMPRGLHCDTYIGARGSLTSANALQRIMEEKKIANYLSIENYNDWRRTGFPVLTKVPNALSDIPRRMLYPQNEILSNPQAVHSAKLTDRLWWDQ